MKPEEKQADILWSRAIKKRAGGRCELCGKEGREAHHLFKRQYKSVRWDLDNGVCLCLGCHHLAHSKPAQFAEWIINRRGKAWYDRLEQRKNVLGKPDMREILKNLSVSPPQNSPLWSFLGRL